MLRLVESLPDTRTGATRPSEPVITAAVARAGELRGRGRDERGRRDGHDDGRCDEPNAHLESVPDDYFAATCL